MPIYPPDPGGQFTSRVHRELAGHLPLPGEPTIAIDDMPARLEKGGPPVIADAKAISSVLKDLDEDGHVSFLKGENGYRLTKAGLDKLTGPVLVPVMVDGEMQMQEPPPLDGAELEAAEAHSAAVAKADAEGDKEAAKERVKQLKAELKTAEAEVKGH